jgi:hypothetical protein
MYVATNPQDLTAKTILERLSDLKNHPDEEIVPYQEFNVEGKLYYFTPGGFLYRREWGTEEVVASSAGTSPARHGGIGCPQLIEGLPDAKVL